MSHKKTSKLYMILFLAIVAPLSGLSMIMTIRYRLTGKPDMKYWSGIVSEDQNLESVFTANFVGRYQFINGNGLIRRLLGQREMNQVVRLDNGYLAELQPRIRPEDLNRRADRVADLQDELTQRGIAFVYAAAPSKINPADPELPAGEEDYNNANMDVFLSRLQERGTNSMDLRSVLSKDGHYEDCFYRTDHHWTTEGAFAAYQALAGWLEQNAGFDIPAQVTDPSSYHTEIYPGYHLGSRGRRTGIYYAGVDDFDLILPSFSTSLHEENKNLDGDFRKVFINEDGLARREYFTQDVYDKTLEKAVGTFTNRMAPNDKTIILVADSFGQALSPYLALSSKHLIYLSAYDAENLPAACAQYHPDAVILLQCSITHYQSDDSFNFGTWN